MAKTQNIYFTGPVCDEAVAQTRSQIYAIMEDEPNAPITIDFNSPGGSVFAGLDLFGVIREASKKGHEITTRISGYSCSMAGVLVQAGDHRQIREDSMLHIHEAASGGGGKASEVKEQAELLARLTRQICEIYARRSTITADEIEARMSRQEWWLDSKEALYLGFVDEII